MSADNIRTPGVRFKIDSDGIARPVKPVRVTLPNHEAEIARLSAQAVDMGLSRPTGTSVRQQTSTAAQIARYSALGRELGVSGPDAGSPGAMPSLGR